MKNDQVTIMDLINNRIEIIKSDLRLMRIRAEIAWVNLRIWWLK